MAKENQTERAYVVLGRDGSHMLTIKAVNINVSNTGTFIYVDGADGTRVGIFATESVMGIFAKEFAQK